MKLWPHKFRLTAKMAMVDPSMIEIALSETNMGDEPYESAFGIHPYFAVSNALAVAVDGKALPRPNGDTTKFPADGKEHALCDVARGRAYTVDAPYADSWWIWNPGDERTPICKTLAPDEWHRFWCLEALMREPKLLAPGETRVYKVGVSISTPKSRQGL
jgi:glucose-6-phosphate 1-epimerase